MKLKKELVKFLGKGVYGAVHLVRYTKSDGSSFHVAVKSTLAEWYNLLDAELQVLRKLKGCPRIVECLRDKLNEDVDDDGEKIYELHLEYAPEGSLRAFVNSYTYRKLPDPMVRDFTRMILEGLVSIHGHGYVHCDLKPDNLLIFRRGDSYELKICDFGISLKVGEIPDHWAHDYPFVGTPNYMPPESLQDGVAMETLDLWSLGCLVLEMYTGVVPWSGIKSLDVENLLCGGKAPEIPETLPCDAKEFIETCFASNPKERRSASELLTHQFLTRDDLLPHESLPREKGETEKMIALAEIQLRHLEIEVEAKNQIDGDYVLL